MTDGPRGWGAPLHARVLDVTAAGPGTALLDLGCGPGVFSRAAVDRGALVTGVDHDPQAVRHAAAEVPDVTFQVGDAHELDLRDGSFDVVAAVQLLTHVANPLRVLREMGRVARPGGVVAVTVWGREAECDVRAFGEALAPWLPPRAPHGPPPLTDPERLCEIVTLAGLEVDQVDEVGCPFDYADADAVIEPLFASGLARAVGRHAHPAAVREAVLARLEPLRTPGGGYRLHNLFRVLTARTR
ncbi:MAG: class I SAM-dependent methyltransferase [Pseudonocardia sp.]